MKLTLHPGSAIVGAVLIVVPFILMSAQAELHWPRQVPMPVSVQEMPDPHDMVVIREEDGPYTVPEGKLFVLTGLGCSSYSDDDARLLVDGVLELQVRRYAIPSVLQVPQGFTVTSGSSIEAREGMLAAVKNRDYSAVWRLPANRVRGLVGAD